MMEHANSMLCRCCSCASRQVLSIRASLAWQVPSLEPATHVYAAWEGFARSAMQAVGKLFSASHTAKVRPEASCRPSTDVK